MRFWHELAQQQQWEQEERRRLLDRQRAQPCTSNRQRSARHEAAHAVSALAVGKPVGVIALDKDGGYFRSGPSDSSPRPAEVETAAMRDLLAGMKRDGSQTASTLNRMIVEVSPLAYESMLGLPGRHDTCAVDLERARLQAEAVTSTRDEASRLLDRAVARADEIVGRHRHHIEVLGDELLQRGRMNGTEVKRVLRDAGFRMDAPPSDASLRYRHGTLAPLPRQQQRRDPNRREIYAGGVRVGFVEALHDEHDGEELGFVAYRASDGEVVGWEADAEAAARLL
jgi:hypothetical protein